MSEWMSPAAMALQILAVTIGTVGFSLLFGVPSLYYPYCGLIGGVSWFFYLLMEPLGSPAAATLLVTVLVVLMSRWFAVRKHCPVTIFLISGIIPLVPGAGIYWASYYVVTNQLERAATTGFQALKVAVAVVLGIILVFELPQKIFLMGVKKEEK